MADNSIEETLSEEMINETLAQSFPASDPPSWTLGRERRKPESDTGNARSMESEKRKARNWRARSALVCIALASGVILLARSRLRRRSDWRGSLPSRIRRFTRLH